MLHCNPRITTRVALPERGNSEWLAAIPAGLALFYTLLLLLDV